MTVEVKIKLDQVAKNGILKSLENIGAKVRNQAVLNGLQKVGLAVERDGKRNAPVKTGRLRASIEAGKPRRIGDKFEIKVSTNVNYAQYVEFGTPRQAAHPFLRPAALSNQREMQKIFDEEVKKSVLNARVTF